jgi:hypothetical protein
MHRLAFLFVHYPACAAMRVRCVRVRYHTISFSRALMTRICRRVGL